MAFYGLKPPLADEAETRQTSAAPTIAAPTSAVAGPAMIAAPQPAPLPSPASRSGGFGSILDTSTNVAEISGELMGKDSQIMQRAQTRGLQSANRRGLVNSSISGQAVEAAQMDAVLPVASQQAQLNQQREMANREVGTSNRRGAESMVTSFQSLYQNTIANIMGNRNLKGPARTAQVEAAQATLDRQIRMAESLFSIQIDW